MDNPEPVNITIYDIQGNEIFKKVREFWTGIDEQIVSINIDKYVSGTYIVVVKSENAEGFTKFRIIK